MRLWVLAAAGDGTRSSVGQEQDRWGIPTREPEAATEKCGRGAVEKEDALGVAVWLKLSLEERGRKR